MKRFLQVMFAFLLILLVSVNFSVAQSSCSLYQGSFEVKLVSFENDAYTWEVTNVDKQAVNYVAFELPVNVSVVSPTGNYAGNFNWNVSFPSGNNNPSFNSIKFQQTGPGKLNNGDTETFVFQLESGETLNQHGTKVEVSNGPESQAFTFDESCGVLPVELVSFNAVASGTAVLLNWKTASETNNSGFEVQVERNGEFNSVGWVDGAGTTTEAQRYDFRVPDVQAGTVLFRLKQVDFDGQFEYSPVVEVSVVTENLALAAYPNPVAGSVGYVDVSTPTSGQVDVTLYNLVGQKVKDIYSGELNTDAKSFSYGTNGLANGVYFVRVSSERGVQTRRVSVVR